MPKCYKCKKECLESELSGGLCIYCMKEPNNKIWNEEIYNLSNGIIMLPILIFIISIFTLAASFLNPIIMMFGISFFSNSLPVILSVKYVQKFLLGKDQNGIQIGIIFCIIEFIINIVTIVCLLDLNVPIWLILLYVIVIMMPSIFFLYKIIHYKRQLKKKAL